MKWALTGDSAELIRRWLFVFAARGAKALVDPKGDSSFWARESVREALDLSNNVASLFWTFT